MWPLREALRQLAKQTGEWAGIPMPVDGQRLIIEPTYPYAKLAEINASKPAEDDGWKERNRWYSIRRRCMLGLYEKDGKIALGLEPAFHHIAMDLQTLGCADVWGIEQETNALALLQSMLRPRSFRQYLLTGMFLETSQRSGVTYLFRRLKPTVACAPDRKRGNDGMRVLACLCMHPIAYYAGSWAGAMCPTDDVVAHLILMRADEHMFWKRCNQHPPYRPEAGL